MTDVFLLVPLFKIQPHRRRQLPRQMPEPQLIQPAQQVRGLDRVILLRQPAPGVRQAQQRIRIGKCRVLQHCQQGLEKRMQ